MLTESIKQKIQELFDSTPDNIGVSYGRKISNGEFTGELGITFTVETKLPLEAIDEGQALPSSVTIDGVEYVTDVVEVGKIQALVCDPTTLANCYDWQANPPANQGTFRPLKGGVSLTSFNNITSVGTLGFIAVDTATQALVGITNNHVVIGNAFYTIDRNINGVLENEMSDSVYQNGESGTPQPSLKIGEVLRYVPMNLLGSNTVDVAMVSVNSADISNTESIKQVGLSYTAAMPFASTAEIDNLMSTLPTLYSSGRTSGAKGAGLCGLTISQINYTTLVAGYNLQGVDQDVLFTNCIVFTRSNPGCIEPISAGDSGSALIADFGGTWKIIGVCFAGGGTIAVACRIDEVASQLGIQAWDGSPKNYVNLASKAFKTIPGGSTNKTFTCSGSTYWQVGLNNTAYPCNDITTSTTTSTSSTSTSTTSTSTSTTSSTTTVAPTTTTTTTLEPTTTTTTTTPTYTIGQSALGGIIAYILQPGDPGYIAGEQHGLVVTSSDLSNSTVLGCDGITITGADGINLGTGQQNSIDFLSQCSGVGGAFDLCSNYSNGGYSDWYLPSLGELDKIHANRSLIGGTFGDNYWSSTNPSAIIGNFSTIWMVRNFVGGAPDYVTQLRLSDVMSTRAIRYF
jgi:hypothetical protein